MDNVNTSPMYLVYADSHGVRHYQPWQDVATSGTPIDDEDREMELVGWATDV